MATPKHRFFFLRAPFVPSDKVRKGRGKPVACVCSIINNTDHVQFALSIHNPRDTFDRVRAKEIALDRLNMGKVLGEVPIIPRTGIKAGIMAVIAASEFMNHRAKPMRVPNRVRQAAVHWLASRSEGSSPDVSISIQE
jgi:hypothetical protein